MLRHGGDVVKIIMGIDTAKAEEIKRKNREWSKKYREAHPERIKEALRKWREKNKDRHKQMTKKWRENNPDRFLNTRKEYLKRTAEKIRENDRIRYKKNREKIREQRKYCNNPKLRERDHLYRENNPEKYKEKYRNYRKKHPEKIKDGYKLRRARKRGNGFFENIISLEIYERDCWICQICLKKVNKKLKWPNRLSASLDHIIPLSKGGTHTRINVQLAHLKCNMKTGDRGIKQLFLFKE